MRPISRTGANALIDPLIESLIEPERKRQVELLAALVAKNDRAGGSPGIFHFEGQFFHSRPYNEFLRAEKRKVMPSVEQDAAEFKKIRDKLENDIKRLRQGLSVVLARCTSTQDVRDALPENLVNELPFLQGHPRTRPEGYVLEEKPLLRAQYERTVELALYYSANRLIY